MLVSYASSLRVTDGTTYMSTDSSHDSNWYRDVLIVVEKSITTAYASAHDRRQYGNVYVDTKSGVDLTRAERQFCFAHIFSAMVRRCLAASGGKKYKCKVIYPDCAVAYSNEPVMLEPLDNP
jgi:hypothetical protein